MTDPLADRFVLGAAQLGLAYGIANRNSGPADAMALLATAEAAGVTQVDTAAHYGTSENAIGAYLRTRSGSPLSVISKLHPQAVFDRPESVRDAVAISCERIGRPLAALLVNRVEHLAAWEGPIGDGLRRARDEGLTRALGASVYTPEAFARTLDIADMSCIQAPFNVLDRRLIESGLLARAAARGVTVYLRSLFLQGLLVMDAPPSRMAFAAPAVTGFRAVCAHHRIRPAAAALGWAARRSGQARLVIGCDSTAQFRDTFALLADVPLSDDCMADLDALPQADERLVDPSSWPAG